MPQEPAPQDPVSQEPGQQDPVGQGPSPQDLEYANSVLAMVSGMDGSSLELPTAATEMIRLIQNPELQTKVDAYAQMSGKWAGVRNMLKSQTTMGDGTTLHDFMARDDTAFSGAIKDSLHFMTNFAEWGLHGVQRQVGMRETDLHGTVAKGMRNLAAGVGAAGLDTDPEMTEELYGYDGPAQDFWLQKSAEQLLQMTKQQADWNDDPRSDLFKELPYEEQMALALEQVYATFDEEAQQMGLWEHTVYGAKTMGPHFAAFMAFKAPLLGRVGRSVSGSTASTRLAQIAPQLSKKWGLQFAAAHGGKLAGAVGTGAVYGSAESLMPMTALEKDFIHNSENPVAAEEMIRANKLGTLTAMWPLYEILGAGGSKVSKLLSGGDALTKTVAPTWRRIGAGMLGHGVVTGGGMSMLPMLETMTNQQGRESMWHFVESAYAGELDWDELQEWGGQTFGGSMGPFAVLGGIMHMRALPGISKNSQKMIDRMAKRIIEEAPPELREALALHQIESLDMGTKMAQKLVADAIARDIQGIMAGEPQRAGSTKDPKTGKETPGRTEGNVAGTERVESEITDVLMDLFNLFPEAQRSTMGQHVRDAAARVRAREPESTAENWLDYQADMGRPLIDRITEGVKAGKFNLKNWQQGDVGNMLESGYQRLFLRRLWTQKLAFESAVTKRTAELPKRSGERSMDRTPQAPPRPPTPAPSNPNGPKYPGKMRPGPRMLRLTQETKAWAEASAELPGAMEAVEGYVGGQEARTSSLAAVGRVLGDHAPTVVEQWDDIVEAPEWDNAAGNIVSFFADTLAKSGKGRESRKPLARSIMKMIKESGSDHGQPRGSTAATNEAQILRRVVGTLTNAPGGAEAMEWLLSQNSDYITHLFGQEKQDSPKLKANWAKGNRSPEVYTPGKARKSKPKAPRTTAQRRAAARKQKKAENAIANGIVQSLSEFVDSTAEQKQEPQTQSDTDATLEKPGQADPAAAEPAKPDSEASKPSEPELVDDQNLTKNPPQVEDSPGADIVTAIEPAVEGNDPRVEDIGGARLFRTDLVEGMDPVYMGIVAIEAIHRHPDLQPREWSKFPRGVDKRRVATYVANFKAASVNPGKFAWLEKDGAEGWYLLDGHHTLATLEDVGEDAMTGTFLRGLTWDQAVGIANTQNNKRENLTVIETANAVAYMMDQPGAEQADVAKEWNKKAIWVRQMTDIAGLPDGVLSMAKTGNLGENEKIVENTLAKLGEAHRLYPDSMNDMAMERVARQISARKWYDKQQKITDFLEVYNNITTAEQKRADDQGDAGGGMLFPDMQPTKEAMDIIAEITEARAVGRSAVREVNAAKRTVEKWRKTATESERASYNEVLGKAEREFSQARQRLRYLDMVKDRVLQGSMNVDEAMDAAAVTDAQVIQDFLEGITKPTHIEPKGADNDLLDPPVAAANDPTLGADNSGPLEEWSPSNAVSGDAGGKSGRTKGAGGSPASQGNGEGWEARLKELQAALVVAKKQRTELAPENNKAKDFNEDAYIEAAENAKDISDEISDIKSNIWQGAELIHNWRGPSVGTSTRYLSGEEVAQRADELMTFDGMSRDQVRRIATHDYVADQMVPIAALLKSSANDQLRDYVEDGELRETDPHGTGFPTEYEKPTPPITVGPDGEVLDGWNRVLQAKLDGFSHISAYVAVDPGKVSRNKFNGLTWKGKEPSIVGADDLAIAKKESKRLGRQITEEEKVMGAARKAGNEIDNSLRRLNEQNVQEKGILDAAIANYKAAKPAKKRIVEIKPAGEGVVTVDSRASGTEIFRHGSRQEMRESNDLFQDWKKDGLLVTFSSRAQAIREANRLADEYKDSTFVVYPINPEKPTGRSHIGWFQKLKKAITDLADKIKASPEFQEALKRATGDGKNTTFKSGADMEQLGGMMDMGMVVMKMGARSIKEWGGFMKQHMPSGMHEYLPTVWNAIAASPEYSHLPRWNSSDSKALGISVPDAVKPTSQAAKDYPGAFRTPKESPGGIDRKDDRLTIDEQLASVRAEDMERMMGKRAEDASFLIDAFYQDLPKPTQKLEHPIRANLMDHQKLLSDVFVTALTDGGKNAVLDCSGTGTGKTWTTMATALEMQRRNGGKIIIVTSNNAAIESWRKNDFKDMEIDPARIGFVQDMKDADKDIILMSYYNFQTRKSRNTGELVGKLDEFDVAMEDGTIGQIVWDEAHRAGTWFKGTREAQRVVERMDRAYAKDVKQIFSTATPYDDPAGMRWMEPLGIWGTGEHAFRGFLDGLGYTTVSKGKNAGFSVTRPDEKRMPYVHLKLIRLRQMLAEQGQQVGWDMSGEGVDNVFMKLNVSPEQENTYWAVAESYKFLSGVLADAGMKALSTMSAAWRVNHANRVVEDIATTNAIDFAIAANEVGGRFLFLSTYKSPKAEGSILKILEKKRGKQNLSALDHIERTQGPDVAAAMYARAVKHDGAMGSQPPILDHLDKALRAKGLNGLKVSGEITPAERVAVLERWKDGNESIDYLIGTRATLGESISAQDTYGRQIYQYVASLPWTGREVVQELGRAHRIGELTKPVIAWAVAEQFPAVIAKSEKVAARLHAVRAGVQGMTSDPTNLENAKDMAAFFLSAKDSDRQAMVDVIAQEDAILDARTLGKQPQAFVKGTDLPPMDLLTPSQFFDEAGEVRTPPAEKADETGATRSESEDYGSYDEWKLAATRHVEAVFADLDAEQVTDPGAYNPVGLMEMVERSSAARDLAKLLDSRDVRGNETEAREFIDGLLLNRVPGEGEGLKTLPKPGGAESGALDLRILSAPYKLTAFLLHSSLRVFKADPMHYERPEYPPNLSLAGNRFNKALRKWLDDPINMYGYRIVEPMLEANRDYLSFMSSAAPAYERVRKAAIREYGWSFLQNEGKYVGWAMGMERYDSAVGPEGGRIGRLEEYQNGAREWTPELKQRAAEDGFDTAEAWLEAQPSYRELVEGSETSQALTDYYEFGRDMLDVLWKKHLSNNKEFQRLMREKEHAAQRIDHAPEEMREQAIGEFEEAAALVEAYFEEKGVQDYFPHFWPEKNGVRQGPAFFKVINKPVYSQFVATGRVSWETGWLDDPEVVLWNYISQMAKKVHMDRGTNAIETTLEGEWARINTKTLLPIEKQGPEYTQSKGGQLVESLTFAKQKKVHEQGDIMTLPAKRVRYKGKAYDALPGQTRNDMRGLVLREVQSVDNIDRPAELFFTPKEAAGIYLEAKVGGIRQFGDDTEAIQGMERWLKHLMGGREYAALDRVIDAHTNFFYRTTLGFLNVKVAQTNLMGGMTLIMGRLGPVAAMRGSAALVGTGQMSVDLRSALHKSGIFSKAQLAYQMELSANYRQTRGTVVGQAVETAKLAAARLAKNADLLHMAPFMISETYLRMTAFAAGYSTSRSQGHDDATAQLHALRAVGSTQMWYDSPNTAMISWSSGGRTLMQFVSYGIKAMNIYKLNVSQGWRGIKDSAGGYTARPGDVKSAATALRISAFGFLFTTGLAMGTQAIMNALGDDDEENEGLDASYVNGMKIRDTYAADVWWRPMAGKIKEETGVDLTDSYIPGLMLPNGASMPLRAAGNSIDFAYDIMKGDPKASERYGYRQQSLYIPGQLRRALMIQDVGGENSDIDKRVEEIQEQLRGFSFMGMEPFSSVPELKDMRKLQGFYDTQRPFLMEDGAGNEMYSMSGPMTIAQFLFTGQDPRIERSIEYGEDMRYNREVRASRKEYVRDAYKALKIEEAEGALPSAAHDERLADIVQYAKQEGILFDLRTQRRWEVEAAEIHQPTARRIKSSSADQFQYWEHLVGAVEANAITFSAFFEAQDDAKRNRGELYRMWLDVPGNRERLESAISNMESKRSSTMEKDNAADESE
uniref:Helicase ATP-binding domain-containing protein n=1 Tax=uncultured marine virus TaxID=186617 RepID=A0A0F7KZT5_9VIRU|nr:hypothetical protein [uncultured marine virus]